MHIYYAEHSLSTLLYIYYIKYVYCIYYVYILNRAYSAYRAYRVQMQYRECIEDTVTDTYPYTLYTETLHTRVCVLHLSL